ncbi:MAG: BNR-4 repeat-containing protein [Gemmatimonadota bacterium]
MVSASHLPASHRGVWYASGTANALPGHGHVYSGPMATYCAWHRPMAVYAPEVERTFWVYGNADNGPTITAFDHGAGRFLEPVVLGHNPDGDAHRNPTLLLDEDGLLYVFWGAHADQPTRVCRSARPHDLSEWLTLPSLPGRVSTYPQPWQLVEGEVFVCHRHPPGWGYCISRNGGRSWEEAAPFVDFPEDRGWAVSVYGVSVAAAGPCPRRLHFAWSRVGGGTEAQVESTHLWARRFHVYYAASDDGGRTWQRSDGAPYALPIAEATAERVHDSGQRGVWLKDIQVDGQGNPCILFLEADAATYESEWMVLRRADGQWRLSTVTRSDHTYDDPALVLIAADDFRIWGPSTPSQPQEDGGEMEEWQSTDGGLTWTNTRHLTRGSPFSHLNVKAALNHQLGTGDLRAFWSYGDSSSPPESSEVSMFYYGEKQEGPVAVRFPGA